MSGVDCVYGFIGIMICAIPTEELKYGQLQPRKTPNLDFEIRFLAAERLSTDGVCRGQEELFMDAGKLRELAQILEENRKLIKNEETVKAVLVDSFIQLLGYDPKLPVEVDREHRADFAQADGKKQSDRMDYVISDKNSKEPRMIIEAKPLGTDLAAKSQQLGRYFAQLENLHFGIITDGCRYLFYGDLDSMNRMDKKPFYEFALDNPKADWEKIAKFLSQFSRDLFDLVPLREEAENARYRQAMVDRLESVFKDPISDKVFLGWLTSDVYKGKGIRTAAVMKRLGKVARDAIEPALLNINESREKLRQGPQPGMKKAVAREKVTEPASNGDGRTSAVTRAIGNRDPRLPLAGTPIRRVWRGVNVEVVEQPDGTFTMTADGQTKVTGAKSLSGAVQTFLRLAGCVRTVNGFAWFGLGNAK